MSFVIFFELIFVDSENIIQPECFIYIIFALLSDIDMNEDAQKLTKSWLRNLRPS